MTAQAQVWVTFAAADRQFHLAVPFKDGMTALDAIEQSGIADLIDLPEPLRLGIFGAHLQNHHQLLTAGDRVEIYRALTINPKDIRRNRAINHPVGRFSQGNRFKQLKQ